MTDVAIAIVGIGVFVALMIIDVTLMRIAEALEKIANK